jgi:cytochrome d ubiquinol oxidase subunit II
MVSTTNAAYNLTVSNSASGSYALKVMTVVAVIFFPLVLIYQAWNYHVFKGRLPAPPEQNDPVPESAADGPAAGEVR